MLAYGFPGGQVLQKLYVYKDIKEKLRLSQELCTHIQDKINSPVKLRQQACKK